MQPELKHAGMKKSSVTPFGYTFLVIGLLVQLVTCYVSKDSTLSVVSGCLGICSVVLCSEGSMWTYVFGFAQIITYSLLCYQQRLYGTLVLNGYYFLTMFYGVWCWQQRMLDDKSQHVVLPRSLPLSWWGGLGIGLPVVSAVVGWFLSQYTNDSQPYLDAFTTIPSVVGQVLMIMVYREQWILWLLVDSVYAVMWLRAGDSCMFVLHIFWCINCIYGWLHWTKTMRSAHA